VTSQLNNCIQFHICKRSVVRLRWLRKRLSGWLCHYCFSILSLQTGTLHWLRWLRNQLCINSCLCWLRKWVQPTVWAGL